MHSSRMRTARLLTDRGGVLHNTPILYGTPLMEPPLLRMATPAKDGTP